MAYKTVLCEPCLYVETEIEAVGFCLTCAECMCSKCVLDHRKTKITRNHSIQQDSIPENVEVIKAMNEIMECPVHREMKIAYRCSEHGVCVCTVCRVDTHRNCDNVFEISKTEYAERDLSSVRERITELGETAASLRKRKEENKTSLYQNQAQILSEQEAIIQRAINELEDLKLQYRRKTNEQLQIAVSEIDEDIESIVGIETGNTRSQDILEAALKYGDDECPKVTARLLIDTIGKHRDLVSVIQKKDVMLKLAFEKSSDSINFTSLGTISLLRSESNEPKTDLECGIEKTSDELEENDANLFVERTGDKSSPHSLPTVGENFITGKMQVCVRAQIDKKPCSILGSVVLHEGHIVIIDNENSNIKLLSPDHILLDVLGLPGRPVRICAIGKDKVAVSFGRVKRINRYIVEGSKVLYVGGFPTSLFNHGISFDGKNIVTLMSDQDYDSNNNSKDDTIQVEVRDPYNGTISDVIRDFKVVGKKSWSLVLRNTQAISYFESNTIIIAELNRILCFDLIKESQKTVAIEKRYYVCSGEIPKEGIENITSGRNSIYACTRSGSVLQMAISNYNNNRVIVSDVDERVTSITVDDKNSRIILGCGDHDSVHVYKFKTVPNV